MNSQPLLQGSEVIKEVALSPINCTIGYETNESLCDTEKTCTGGFLDGGKLAWRAQKATIEIFNPVDGGKHAAWTFTSPSHTSSVKITSVCGIGVNNITHVVIGAQVNESKLQGLVAVLSMRRSRIIRAFTFSNKVTNVCMVMGGESPVDPATIANELRACEGLLAVSTSHAGLYLVDICLDLGYDKVTSDEIWPALYSEILIPDADPESTRRKALLKNHHPILNLSENFNKDGNIFRFLGPDGNILYEAPNDTIEITSLSYFPQMASLVVGYSFGSFQVINLSLIIVDCASPFEKNLPPIVAVSYQEPENDPRSYVYLWISRSWSDEDYEVLDNINDTSGFSLYAMNYEKKEWIEGHGLWYQSLISISARFDFEALDIMQKRNTGMSVILSSVTVTQATTSGDLCLSGQRVALAPSDDESDPVPDLSLTFFCWQTSVIERGQLKTNQYMAVFDINQWYQSQMPSQLRYDVEELCPYMSFCVLSDVGSITAVSPSRGSWSRYLSRYTSEKDWYPASLSFDVRILCESCIVNMHCSSIQHKVLSSVVEQGPGALVEPDVSHAACEYVGILCKNSIPSNPSVEHIVQRENLLTVILDHQLISFITNCITAFSDGKFSNVGCSLTLISDWAWNQVFVLRSSYDSLCCSFFDPSLPLSNDCIPTLHRHLVSFRHIHSILTALSDATSSATGVESEEVEGRIKVIELLQMHLQACLWFHQNGLLPEISARKQSGDIRIPYPAKTLQTMYDDRHAELRKVNPSKSLSEMLLIETLTEECGDALKEIWRKDGSDGVYPPPSFHALLTIYLLPQIPIVTKHRIVQYLFLDLASLLSENHGSVVEELVKFPSSFSLSPSIIKLTQAFWLIDHKDFQEGKGVLLHPLIDPEHITTKQHQTIIRAMLYQNEEKCSIAYCEVREPWHLKAHNTQLHVNLLLANGKIREAFHLQRSRPHAFSRQKLLHCLFAGCEEVGRLESITHLPLTSDEEQEFIKYLNRSKDPSAKDILFTYSLQKSKMCGSLEDNCDGSVSKFERTRQALMQGFLAHLPNTHETKVTDSQSFKSMYSKPKPLSAFVRQTPLSAKANETAIGQKSTMPFTPFRSRNQRREQWKERTGLQESTDDRDLSHMVIPSVKGTPIGRRRSKDKTNVSDIFDIPDLETSLMSPKSTLESHVLEQFEDIIRKTHNVEKVHTSQPASTLSMDVLSLLKTPPVSAKKKFNSRTLPDTPQSILKIRHRAYNFMDIDSPVLPESKISSSSKLSITANDDSFGISSHTDWTPKQLRFNFPRGETPTPPLSDEAVLLSSAEESPKDSDSDHIQITSSTTKKGRTSITQISYPDQSFNPEELYEGTEIRTVHSVPAECSKLSNSSVRSEDSFHSVVDESMDYLASFKPSSPILTSSVEKTPVHSPSSLHDSSLDASSFTASTYMHESVITRRTLNYDEQNNSPKDPSDSELNNSNDDFNSTSNYVLRFSDSEENSEDEYKVSQRSPIHSEKTQNQGDSVKTTQFEGTEDKFENSCPKISPLHSTRKDLSTIIQEKLSETDSDETIPFNESSNEPLESFTADLLPLQSTKSSPKKISNLETITLTPKSSPGKLSDSETGEGVNASPGSSHNKLSDTEVIDASPKNYENITVSPKSFGKPTNMKTSNASPKSSPERPSNLEVIDVSAEKLTDLKTSQVKETTTPTKENLPNVPESPGANSEPTKSPAVLKKLSENESHSEDNHKEEMPVVSDLLKTPPRSKKNTSSAVVTPLRRSRRLSSTPTHAPTENLIATPSRRKRKISELSETKEAETPSTRKKSCSKDISKIDASNADDVFNPSEINEPDEPSPIDSSVVEKEENLDNSIVFKRTRRSMKEFLPEVSTSASNRRSRRSKSVEPMNTVNENSSPTSLAEKVKQRAQELNIPKEAFLLSSTTPKRRRSSTSEISESEANLGAQVTPSRPKRHLSASPATPSTRSTRRSSAMQLETIQEDKRLDNVGTPARSTRSQRHRSTLNSVSDTEADTNEASASETEYNLLKENTSTQQTNTTTSQKRKRRTKRLTSLKMPQLPEESDLEEQKPVAGNTRRSQRKRSPRL